MDLDDLIVEHLEDETVEAEPHPDPDPTPAVTPNGVTAMAVHNQHLYVMLGGRMYRNPLRRRNDAWEEVELPNG